MSTAQWPGPKIGDDVPVDSIQPGGGFCVGLERRWGYWRRFWLRTFRPGYVNEMLEKRQGECAGCTHDIIDSRDLKLYRNVCGFWFGSEDDRFQWRDRLGLARTGLAEVVFGTLLTVAAMTAIVALARSTDEKSIWLAAAPVLILWYQAVRFFRDPARKTPQDPRALISPSDGVVTDLHEVEDSDFPGSRAYRVSIYLSPWDVHLNRNPRSAKVTAVRYFPGRFLNARHKDCAVQNEQLWVDLEEPNGRVIRIKQISGAMARRLVCWIKPGEQVVAGHRYGMIKYGSRADVLIPAGDSFKVTTKVGERVHAGESVLIEFEA